MQNYLSINIGWGVGTAMGVWVSGGITGGHINPAVCLFSTTMFFVPYVISSILDHPYVCCVQRIPVEKSPRTLPAQAQMTRTRY